MTITVPKRKGKRQIRVSPETWDKAKALYEADKSLRDIEKATGIDFSNLAKKAKSEGWKRGVLPRLINDSVKVQEEFTTLSLPQQEVVVAEVDRLMGFRRRRNTIADIAYDRIEKELPQCEPYLVKSMIEAADKVGVMVEIAPRHATPNMLNLHQNSVHVVNVDNREQNIQHLKKLLSGRLIDA